MGRDDQLLSVVFGVAVLGIAVLAVAVLTGNAILALVVIAIAAVGLVLLIRDWLTDRGQTEAAASVSESPDGTEEHDAGPTMDADEFEPDVSYDEGEESEPSSQTAKDDAE
jgi:hypothetical protein